MSAWIVDGVLPARKAEYRWEIPAAAVAALKEQREKPVEGMLTVEAVAARLGLKIIAVREYAAAGRLKGSKIGPDARRWWFREEDVAEFEASRNGRRRRV